MHTDSSYTDEEIVTHALAQKEFFGMLVERYQAPLARYVKRLGVRDDDDAADILQEVFIKVYRKLNDFDRSLKFSSWIYRIAHNETVSWFRRRNVRPEGHQIDDPETLLELTASAGLSSEVAFDRKLDAKKVKQAVGKLRQKYRDVIILRFFEHKEYEEISDILEIPVGSVGTLIHRAKKQLLEHLDREEIAHE